MTSDATVEAVAIAIHPGWLVITEPVLIVMSPHLPDPSTYIGRVVDEPTTPHAERCLSLEELAHLGRATISRSSLLPPQLTRARQWPKIGEPCPATIFPRAVFVSLRLSLLRGLMSIRHGGPHQETLLAGIPFWRNGSAAAALRRFGYPLA
jgi:hypothetical protein